jgi:hypothetical protein
VVLQIERDSRFQYVAFEIDDGMLAVIGLATKCYWLFSIGWRNLKTGDGSWHES